MGKRQAMQRVANGADPISNPFAAAEVTGWESWIQDLFENCCGRNCDQQCCVSALTRGAHHLHGELNIRRRYLDAFIDASRFVSRDRQPWGWYPLIDTPILRVGLISLYHFCSIPLHDHPNAYGVQKVVAGKVRIQEYQFAPDSDRHHALVSLERVSDHLLVKDECSVLTPSFRNLHELKSASSRSVVLSMMVNPYRPQDRSWYYQLPFLQRGNRGFYKRIRKRHAALEDLNMKTK